MVSKSVKWFVLTDKDIEKIRVLKWEKHGINYRVMKKGYDEYKLTVSDPIEFEKFVKDQEMKELRIIYEPQSPSWGNIQVEKPKKK